MIDQDKMRALAAKLRERDAFNSMHGDPILLDAADAIDLLLAELEAAAADKRDAERYRWMRAQHWISIFEEETAIHCMDQKARLQDALAQRQGEGS